MNNQCIYINYVGFQIPAAACEKVASNLRFEFQLRHVRKLQVT